LGAQPSRLLADVVRTGMIPVAVGVLLGTVGALAVSGALTRFLFEVAPTDPMAFLVAAGALLLAGVVAALIPAVRASRTDPVVALRSE